LKRVIFLHGLVLVLILLIAFSPFLVAMIAGSIASANGCRLDEGNIHPCIVNGQDIGQTLYTLGMMGWFAIATIPLGLAAAGIYLVGVILFYLFSRLYRRKRQLSNT
jgi:hypothetical protein